MAHAIQAYPAATEIGPYSWTGAGVTSLPQPGQRNNSALSTAALLEWSAMWGLVCYIGGVVRWPLVAKDSSDLSFAPSGSSSFQPRTAADEPAT